MARKPITFRIKREDGTAYTATLERPGFEWLPRHNGNGMILSPVREDMLVDTARLYGHYLYHAQFDRRFYLGAYWYVAEYGSWESVIMGGGRGSRRTEWHNNEDEARERVEKWFTRRYRFANPVSNS